MKEEKDNLLPPMNIAALPPSNSFRLLNGFEWGALSIVNVRATVILLYLPYVLLELALEGSSVMNSAKVRLIRVSIVEFISRSEAGKLERILKIFDSCRVRSVNG